MTRLTTYLFLATLLVSMSLHAQPEDVTGWEGIPWCSGHEVIQERFGDRFQPYAEPLPSAISRFVESHFIIRDFELGNRQVDIRLLEGPDHELLGVYAIKMSKSLEKFTADFEYLKKFLV
ncbi:MAG: hypothetical protein V3T39_03845, partial [Gammaproteobacteria bacterium]